MAPLIEQIRGLLGNPAPAETCPECGIDAVQAEVPWLARPVAAGAMRPHRRELCGCCAAVLMETLRLSPEAAASARVEPIALQTASRTGTAG